MDKSAHTKYGMHALLKKRWSPRAFDQRPVEEEKLLRILEAASWAPSSFNEQPWRFIVGIKGRTPYDKMLNALLPGNQVWAKSAPVLLFLLGKKTFSYDGNDNLVYRYDTGQAAAYMTFQAQAEGLFVHQMGGINREKIKMSFDIPDEFAVLTGAAVGYMGNPEILPEDLQDAEKAKRDRKPLSELVFGTSFGDTSDLISE